jgi:cell division protein FtsL
MKTVKQNLTIERLESQIAELASDYSELKNIFVRNLYTNILNIQHLSIFTYIALTIAIISIIFTAVNTRRTLNRLKRIEEYIKNIIEDTEIE